MATAARTTKGTAARGAHGKRDEESRIPRLYNGDHLTVEEFERRYTAMPEGTKAELIWGVVYMSSPVRRGHGRAHFQLITWLGTYETHTPGLEGGDNLTVRLAVGLNELQPDACLYLLPGYGGRTQVDEDDYIKGAPELVAEITASTEGFDLHEKLEAYRQNGVREYIVWRIADRAIDWFALRGAEYRRLKLSPDGLYRSKVFPGLWLDPTALVAGKRARVLEVVQQGIASPEHRLFVAKLQVKKK